MRTKVIMLSFFLLLSIFLGVSAQETEIATYYSGIWEYIDNNTGITLSGYNGDDITLTIPEILDGYPVTQIGKELFKNNRTIESVFIPDSVKVIGQNVFNGCSSLREVRLPDGLTKIDAGTFRYCIRLEKIDIPFSVTNIGANAFADCLSLQEAMLISVTNIGESAFDNCQKLDSVTISRKLTAIGSYAFRDTPWFERMTDEFVMLGKGILVRYNGNDSTVQVPYGTTMITDAFADNYNIRRVEIPETVLQISSNAFRDAVNLQNITLPPYLTTIGSNAFNGCRSLEHVEVPETVKTLGGSAFANCIMLQRFVVPEAVTSIPGGLFTNCSKLTEVIIPSTVTKIDKNAFNGAPNVRLSVAYGSEAERLLSEYELPYDHDIQQNEGFVYTQDEEGIHIIQYTGGLFDVEIPAQINSFPVISIEADAFQNNSRIRSVSLPLTIKSIEDRAFSNMPDLKSVKLSDGVESLGNNIFSGSANLQEIRFPKGIKKIGDAPLDPDTQTLICAAEGSAAAEQLTAMGYTVHPEDDCMPDPETGSLRADLAALEGNNDDPCDCNIQTIVEYTTYEILRISDGIDILNAERLKNAAEDLILIIPTSVSRIDPDILKDHKIITIVSATGSSAEKFAAEHGIRFLMQYIYYMNM